MSKLNFPISSILNLVKRSTLRVHPAFATSISIFLAISLFVNLGVSSASAATQSTRWTGAEDANSEFSHVIDVMNKKTGLSLSSSDFMIFEDRELATSHFRTYLQTAGGIPVKGMGIRTWTDLNTKATIQVEILVADSHILKTLSRKLSKFNVGPLNSPQLQVRLLNVAKKAVQKHSEDPNFRTTTSRDVWENGELVRIFRITGKRGYHVVQVSIPRAALITIDYRQFPQGDQVRSVAHLTSLGNRADEFSVPARVYPIWEETPDLKLQNRVLTQLKRLKTSVARVTQDPYSKLQSRKYLSDRQDTVLGMTQEGQANGFWSMLDVREKAAQIRTSLAQSPNSFSNGVLLDGRYATVSLHPDVVKKFSGLNFQPGISAQLKPTWKALDSDPNQYEMVPNSALLGRPLTSFEDAFTRQARRLADHDPVTYINDGFDEVQVYWSIDTLFETLHTMGFTDPDLSTRPFNAFLYDPDIEYQDNAFYTDDTINFTTYTSVSQNYARDNSTIWHELGHGIMDRVMGDLIVLNDTGGLSEGMADFIAALVIAKVTKLKPFAGDQDFRIINKTGFNLTNEEHDDGEAFGGAMYDLMSLAAAKDGLAGVDKVADLTIETMRLTRNHPALTAQDWFNHMLFADERGHAPTRAAGELRTFIMKALNGRNFSFDGSGLAELHIFNGSDEVVTGGTGTRYHPNVATLKEDESVSYELKVSTQAGANGVLSYPLKMDVEFNGNALQGAVKWAGEESGKISKTLNSESDFAKFTLTAAGKCEKVNRDDGGCSDYVSIRLYPPGTTQPVAKKRFYVRIKH